MNRDEIRQVVLRSLESVAPEVDATSLDPQQSLRDALDIDSMDILNFAVALHEALQVDIPEKDYPQLDTLDGAVSYLASRLEA